MAWLQCGLGSLRLLGLSVLGGPLYLFLLRFMWIIGFLVAGPAWGSSETMSTNLLSLTGDGVTASAADLRAAAERTAQSAQYGV